MEPIFAHVDDNIVYDEVHISDDIVAQIGGYLLGLVRR
jgi:hypothetical protein